MSSRLLKKPSSFVLTRHSRLTISRASTDVKSFGDCRLTGRTNVALFLHRAVRLIILRVADLVAVFLNSLWRLTVSSRIVMKNVG
jgi:hypothetical protein